MSDQAIANLADAFKTAAMKSAWPELAKMFKAAGIKTSNYDSFFKDPEATAASKTGNAKFVELSAELFDLIVEEFTSKKREAEVLQQSQNIKIKSTLRQQVGEYRKKKEAVAEKSLTDREELAGLQSFFVQMKNIDETAVIRAQRIIQMRRAIEQAKDEQPKTALSAVQSNQARTALTEYAKKASTAPKARLPELAAAAVATLIKHKVEFGHLAGLFAGNEVLTGPGGRAPEFRQYLEEAFITAKEKK